MDKVKLAYQGWVFLKKAASVGFVLKKLRVQAVAGEQEALPVAKLTWRDTCQSPSCSPYIASTFTEVACCTTPTTSRLMALSRQTAAVTDLALYPTADDYQRAVSKATKGKYNRSANKAERLGYSARLIAHNSYSISLYRILASKKVRSHGPVYEAYDAKGVRGEDTRGPFEAPPCNEHWRIDWGVFHADRPDMMAFSSLQRTGNFVNMLHMMGHADVLNAGGMKLLQFAIMRWLIERKAPYVQGVKYLLHGALEQGADGLADWRRYVQQKPTLLAYDRPDSRDLCPADFSPKVYRALYADVRDANMSPKDHFLWHGWLEGRRYKP